MSVYGLTDEAVSALESVIVADRNLPSTGQRNRRVWNTDGSIGAGAIKGVKGCCAGCLDPRYLVIDKLYAGTYIVSKLPVELGGPSVTLESLGLTSGITGISNNLYYWESDTFQYTCDAGTDTYWWRFIIGADGTSTCKAGFGADNAVLYLVHNGSATICTNLAVVRCAIPGYSGPLYEFANFEDWRARCGSKLYIRFPQFQKADLARILPCEVCVKPDSGFGRINYSPIACLDDQLPSPRVGGWPNTLFGSLSSTVSGISQNVVLIGDSDFTSAQILFASCGCSVCAVWNSYINDSPAFLDFYFTDPSDSAIVHLGGPCYATGCDAVLGAGFGFGFSLSGTGTNGKSYASRCCTTVPIADTISGSVTCDLLRNGVSMGTITLTVSE